VVGVLPTQILPMDDSVATPSVKVPPISTATRKLSGFAEEFFTSINGVLIGVGLYLSYRGVHQGSIGDGDQTLFGHFAYGIGGAFAAEATVLDASKGHYIDACAGGFIDMHTAKVEPACSLQCG